MGRPGPRLRLIPARAGKTSTASSGEGPCPAHPRACGENEALAADEPRQRGSSPRVRGKRAARRNRTHAPRLIPARAGKTSPQGTRVHVSRAHPRACGENKPPKPRSRRSPGSSPRVRGKPASELQQSQGAGLIPARAGKTDRRAGLARQLRAHPRACGENNLRLSSVDGPPGSSPRVRGKLSEWETRPYEDGLIPARAGKTHRRSRRTRSSWAHPRACGENGGVGGVGHGGSGSSPRVRGKRMGPPPHPRPAGLIPARAGKTRARRRGLHRQGAHPRACGENPTGAWGPAYSSGSSPRVRGKPASRST